MADPRTIDNLGPNLSREYAEREKRLDATLIPDASKVSSRTTVSVLRPAQGELKALFDTHPPSVSWASFPPPAGYYSQSPAPVNEHTSQLDTGIQRISQASGPKELVQGLEQYKNNKELTLEMISKMNQYHKG